jgi:hypothetical protein
MITPFFMHRVVFAVLRLERLDAVNPSGVFFLIVLSDASDCEQLRRPRLQQEFLESVHSCNISSLGGFVDPPLELEHSYLQLAPG